jgi:hypothetical protein
VDEGIGHASTPPRCESTMIFLRRPVEIRPPRTSMVQAEHDAQPYRMKETAMQYMLLIYGNEANAARADRATVERISPAYAAYTEAMQKARVMVGGGRLRPTSSATTVRAPDGKPQVLDGPYTETKEQLGGYYIVDVPDLDAAISWATRCPAASHGAVEVRPIWSA